MSKYFPTGGFKWIFPKNSDLNKYTSTVSKSYVLDVDLENSKKLHELHSN